MNQERMFTQNQAEAMYIAGGSALLVAYARFLVLAVSYAPDLAKRTGESFLEILKDTPDADQVPAYLMVMALGYALMCPKMIYDSEVQTP